MSRHRPPGFVAVARIVVAVACAACNADSPVDPTQADAPTIAVRIISGDRQFGLNGDTLSAPIIAEVTDLRGVPLPNVEVSWSVSDQGALVASHSRTDVAGRVSAQWVLGASDEHEGYVRASGIVGAPFTASEPTARTLDFGEVDLLRPKTYEGSGQAIHPDFVRTPNDWSAYTQHLVLTPYRNSSTTHENPSMFVSRTGYRWFSKPGTTNPVIRPPEGSYLSDPDMLYEPVRRELWLYYREVGSMNRVMLVRSRDGLAWSEPLLVVEASNHSVISPSVVRLGTRAWRMWSVNGGVGGCGDEKAFVEIRHSLDGMHWSRPRRIALSGGKLDPWHIDVQWVESLQQYWALFPVKEPFGCSTQALYLATSKNGLQWTTYPTPVVRAGQFPELQSIVYRSTFEYVPERDELKFWFSGANQTGFLQLDWRTVVQRWHRADLLNYVNLVTPPPLPNRAPLPFRMIDPP